MLFRKGDRALEMFYTVTGKYLVSEIGVELPPGRLFGELGVLTPDSRRTQSVECIEDGEVLTVTYDKVLELYFQDPDFGFYFLKLTSERLLQNIARLEGIVEQQRKQLAELTSAAEATASEASPDSHQDHGSAILAPPSSKRGRGRPRATRRAATASRCATSSIANRRLSRTSQRPSWRTDTTAWSIR